VNDFLTLIFGSNGGDENPLYTVEVFESNRWIYKGNCSLTMFRRNFNDGRRYRLLDSSGHVLDII